MLQSIIEYSGYRNNFINHIQEIKKNKKTDNTFIQTFKRLNGSLITDEEWLNIYNNMLEETKTQKTTNMSTIYKNLNFIKDLKEPWFFDDASSSALLVEDKGKTK